jgi:hypothetical protein
MLRGEAYGNIRRTRMTVLLTEEHLRKIIEYDLLKEDEISDRSSSVVWCESRWTPPWGFRTCHGMTGGKGLLVARLRARYDLDTLRLSEPDENFLTTNFANSAFQLASSSNPRRSTWPKANRGAIGKPRNPKRRRSKSLPQRQTKGVRHGSRPSLTARRNRNG